MPKSKALASKAVKSETRKQRAGNVGERIVELLKAGPLSRTEIMEKGKISQAALYLHLKKLRDGGAIVAASKDPKKLQLTDSKVLSADLGAARGPKIGGKKKGAAPAKNGAGSLTAELHSFLARLKPIERRGEKFKVLDGIASQASPGIRRVIEEIRQDLTRYSAE